LGSGGSANASFPVSSVTQFGAGSYTVRACADLNGSFVGTVSESNEDNNCGAWTAVTVTAPPANPVSALLTATPEQIYNGDGSALSWTSTNATSCTSSDFSTGDATSGEVTVHPTSTKTYTLTCSNAGSNAYSTATVTVTVASLNISASPTLVQPGGQTTVTWSVSGNVDSCSVSGPGLSASGLSGSRTVTVTGASTYTLSCIAGSLNPTATAHVGLAPQYQEF
jgi:hypothetical protein